MATRISAFVPAFNEEVNIRGCLESLRWADEIVVVDSGSTDGTVEICREFTDRIFQRPWTGFRDQVDYGVRLCRYDWVVCVDADERVSQWSELESLRGFTMGGAECLGFGCFGKIGSIKRGKLADFIVLNQNIFDVPTTELYLTRIERTVLGGNVVYTKK